MKRITDEDESIYNTTDPEVQVLHNRYFLISLLGKGGFSEVHKAYDLKTCTLVACKIHQVNPHWRREQKENYIKHATREYEIHKSLHHENIVELIGKPSWPRPRVCVRRAWWLTMALFCFVADVFEIDNNSFCTVLEYCDGYDLDFQLKQSKRLPEKSAKATLVQLLSALKYLNLPERGRAIIHYDLKPGEKTPLS